MSLERFANTPTPSSASTPWTTLNGGIDNVVTTIVVTSATPFPSSAQYRIVIDNEVMLVTAGAGTTSWTVTRGVEGSTAAAHSNGAGVFHVVTAASLLNAPLAMTTSGDVPYLNSSLNQARLGIGSTGALLFVTSSAPSWSDATKFKWDSTLNSLLISNGTAVADSTSILPKLTVSGTVPVTVAALHTTYSTDVSNGLVLSQDSAGIAMIQAGDGTLATTNKGGHIEINPTARDITVRPGSASSRFIFACANDPANGADFHSAFTHSYANTDSVTNYGNYNFQARVTDGANEATSQFQYLNEMVWTNGGGFTTDLWGIWDSTAVAYGISMLKAQPQVLRVGYAVSGKHFTLQANGPIANADPTTRTASTPLYDGSQTWNNGAVEFTGWKLAITNTASAAGSIVSDQLFGSGGRFAILMNGVVQQQAQNGSTTSLSLYNHANSLTANTTINTLIAYQSAGTIATPLRTQAGQVVLRNAAGGYMAVDDSTSATLVSANRARIDWVVGANDWTTSDNGMFLRFGTTAVGSTTVVNRCLMDETGFTVGATAAARGTTQPTNAINIFDGTAPAGTLTNGVTLYSASGELRVMDAAGNSTLLSPHDPVTNEWIYDSQHSVTGKRLRIDLERMLRELDRRLGGGYIHEGMLA
jgi:hypothetical protein